MAETKSQGLFRKPGYESTLWAKDRLDSLYKFVLYSQSHRSSLNDPVEATLGWIQVLRAVGQRKRPDGRPETRVVQEQVLYPCPMHHSLAPDGAASRSGENPQESGSGLVETVSESMFQRRKGCVSSFEQIECFQRLMALDELELKLNQRVPMGLNQQAARLQKPLAEHLAATCLWRLIPQSRL